MRRTLTPGGRVVIGTPGTIQPTFEILERALVEHVNADLGGFVRSVFSMHDTDSLASLLRGAGLRDVTATLKQATLRLPAPAEFLWQYISLTPMAPIVAQAPEEAKQAMERDVVEGCQPYVTCWWRSRPCAANGDRHRLQVGSESTVRLDARYPFRKEGMSCECIDRVCSS